MSFLLPTLRFVGAQEDHAQKDFLFKKLQLLLTESDRVTDLKEIISRLIDKVHILSDYCRSQAPDWRFIWPSREITVHDLVLFPEFVKDTRVVIPAKYAEDSSSLTLRKGDEWMGGTSGHNTYGSRSHTTSDYSSASIKAKFLTVVRVDHPRSHRSFQFNGKC